MDDRTIAILGRLDGLERENRRLRRVVAGLIVGAFGLGAATLPPRDRQGRTIEAQRLVVRDKEGRVRGSFGVDRDGLPALKLFDHRGLEQIALGIESEDFSALSFSDRATRVQLTTSIEGATSLRLFDTSSREKAALFLRPDSAAGLRIAEGDEAAAVGPLADGPANVEADPGMSSGL